MINLNLQNIEKLIFFDKKIQNLFPEFKHYFNQWNLSKKVVGFKNLGQRSKLDFLNSLTSDHIKKLENYLNDQVVIDKIDYHLVKNYVFSLDDTNLNIDFTGFQEFCIYRNDNQMYISFWK